MSFTHRSDAEQTVDPAAPSIVIPKPAGLAVGDLMVAGLGKDYPDVISTYPTGWTPITPAGGNGTTTGNNILSWIGYKIADAADVAASDFTWTSDSEHWGGVISVFYGMTLGANLVAISTHALVENDATPTSGTIPTPTAGNLIIGMCASAQADTGGLGIATPLGMTAGGNPTTGTGNGDVGMILAHKVSSAGNETAFGANNAESTAESHIYILEFEDAAQAVVGYNQIGYRVRSSVTETLNEPTTGWAAAENVGADIDLDIPFRIRFSYELVAGGAAPTSHKFQYRYDDGGGFGAWTDLAIDAEGGLGRVLEKTEILKATIVAYPDAYSDSAYTNGAATTQLLSDGQGTWSAGDGVEGVNSTSIDPGADLFSEHEIMVIIRRFYGAGVDEVLVGEDFEYRMVESDGTVFTAYTETPAVNVTRVDKHIGGTFSESPGAALVVDDNGNLYMLIESSETAAAVVMMKSTDDGVTWFAQDINNGPDPATGEDMESMDMVIDNTNHRVHIVQMDADDDVIYHQFLTSAHGSAPDTWSVIEEVVQAAVTRTQQVVSIVHRPTTSDIIVAYVHGTPQIAMYRTRNNDGESAGTWDASATDIDNNSNDQFGINMIMGKNGVTHVFYSEDIGLTTSIFHQTFSAADPPVLSGSPDTIASGMGDGSGDLWPMVPPVYYLDGTTEIITLLYKEADNSPWTRSLKDGVLQTAQEVSTREMYDNGNASRQAIGMLAAHGTTTYAWFSDEGAGDARTPMWRHVNEDEAGWGTETQEKAKDANRTGFVMMRCITYNNGVDDVVAYVYDHVWSPLGGSGCIFFDAYTLPSSGTDYVRSTDDPVGVTDSISRVHDAVRAVSDDVGVTDDVTTAKTIKVTISDDVGVIDEAIDVKTGPTNYVRSTDDPVGITDSIETAMEIARTLIDDVGITDDVTAVKTIKIEITDDVGVTDDTTRVHDAKRIATDLVGVIDSVSDNENNRETLTDPVGVTDSVSRIASAVREATDPVGITDEVLVKLVISQEATDDVGVTDSVSRAIDAAREATDPVGVTDSVSTAKTIKVEITDDVGVTDDTTPKLGIQIEITESVGVTDSVSRVASAVRSINEQVGVTDSVSDNENNRETLVDLVGVTDLVERVHDAVRETTDPVGVTDDVVVAKTIKITINDDVGVTDAVSTAAELARTITDPVGVADVVSRVVDALRTITDDVGVTDDTSYDKSGAGVESITDPVGVTDNVSRVIDAKRPVSDDVGITDEVTASKVIKVTITDDVGVTDVAERVHDVVRAITEPIGVTDDTNYVKSGAGVEMINDPVGITDTVTRVASAVRTVFDPVGLTDQVLTAKTIKVEITDAVGVTDEVSSAKEIIVEVTDPVSVLDPVSRVASAVRSIVDPVGVEDSTFTAMNLFVVITDAVGVSDTVTGNLILESYPVDSDNTIIGREHLDMIVSNEHESTIISEESGLV